MAVAALVALGCASGPTPYQPARCGALGDCGYGYHETKLGAGRQVVRVADRVLTSEPTEEGRFFVQFAANTDTPMATLVAHLRRRARELCQADGYASEEITIASYYHTVGTLFGTTQPEAAALVLCRAARRD